MKLSSLKSKLNKMDISFVEVSHTELNKALIFVYNGEYVNACYDLGIEEIDCFYLVTGYDNGSQESERIFFYSFTRLIKFIDKWCKND